MNLFLPIQRTLLRRTLGYFWGKGTRTTHTVTHIAGDKFFSFEWYVLRLDLSFKDILEILEEFPKNIKRVNSFILGLYSKTFLPVSFQ